GMRAPQIRHVRRSVDCLTQDGDFIATLIPGVEALLSFLQLALARNDKPDAHPRNLKAMPSPHSGQTNTKAERTLDHLHRQSEGSASKWHTGQTSLTDTTSLGSNRPTQVPAAIPGSRAADVGRTHRKRCWCCRRALRRSALARQRPEGRRH